MHEPELAYSELTEYMWGDGKRTRYEELSEYGTELWAIAQQQFINAEQSGAWFRHDMRTTGNLRAQTHDEQLDAVRQVEVYGSNALDKLSLLKRLMQEYISGTFYVSAQQWVAQHERDTDARFLKYRKYILHALNGSRANNLVEASLYGHLFSGANTAAVAMWNLIELVTKMCDHPQKHLRNSYPIISQLARTNISQGPQFLNALSGGAVTSAWLKPYFTPSETQVQFARSADSSSTDQSVLDILCTTDVPPQRVRDLAPIGETVGCMFLRSKGLRFPAMRELWQTLIDSSLVRELYLPTVEAWKRELEDAEEIRRCSQAEALSLFIAKASVGSKQRLFTTDAFQQAARFFGLEKSPTLGFEERIALTNYAELLMYEREIIGVK